MTRPTSTIPAIILAIALLLPVAGVAQEIYPNRPIHLVVPFPPGGVTDIVARLVAARMSTALGQPIEVENRSGSRGRIGADFVAKSSPDGYTLLISTATTQIFDAGDYGKSSKDLAPISLLVRVPGVLVVSPAVEASTVRELIALARASPGKYSYASSGIGSPLHRAGLLFAQMADIDIQHASFRGSGAALAELVSGQVSMMFDLLPSALPNIQAGSVRPLAVTVTRRLAVLPDVPTMAESGLPQYETYTWNGLFGPAGTPPTIVERLSREATAAVQLPEIRDKLAELSAEVVGSTPAQLAAHIAAERIKWLPVIKALATPIN